MTYQNCDDAYAHGRSNIPRSDPSYAAKLDRDGDGVACDQPPPGFTPRPAQPTPTATHATPVKTFTSAATTPTLPLTGPATEYTVAGGVLLALGVAGIAVARRRRKY